MSRWKVVVGASSFARVSDKPLRLLREHDVEVTLNPYGRKLSRNETIDFLRGADGILAGLEPLDREILSTCRGKLKALARIGIGMDNVDIQAAQEFGIRVSNTPDGPTQAVAELTVTALLALCRQLIPSSAALHARQWKKLMGVSVMGMKVLLIGYGRIGQADNHGPQGGVQLHFKGDDDHHVAGRHNGGKLRVDFAAHQLELHVVHRPPGFFHIFQRQFDDVVDNRLFDAREFAAFDLGLTAGTAENIFHQSEDKPGVHHHDGVAAQGVHFEDIDGRGHGQRADELAELRHVNGNGVEFHTLAYGVGKGIGTQAGETVIDDFENRHAPADDAILIGKVKGDNIAFVFRLVLGCVDFAAGKPPQQGINFILRQYFVHRTSLLH